MRIITITMGVLYAFASVLSFMNAGKTFIAFAFIIGMLMLIQGAFGVLVCIKVKKRTWHRDYFLTESILSILLSVIVLFNQLIADITVPVFFGMWLMFVGITRIVAVIRCGKDSEKMWARKAGLGVLSLLVGFYSFFNQATFALSVAIIVGICLMVQAMNLIYTGIEIPKGMKSKSDSDSRSKRSESKKNSRSK
ncbi:MAG: DUF308 domain-containing protein [Eubacteriales bacterium]|nr:DUF308 domain-containing protein [Eubacteriales bacterium]